MEWTQFNNKMRIIFLYALFSICSNAVFSQDTIKAKRYFTYDSTEIFLTKDELSVKLPVNLNPVFDYPIRDISVCMGPDSVYYMTGTTGYPDWWAVTGDIQIWKSKDLKNWEPLITKPRKRSMVWNIDRDGSKWNKVITLRDGAPFRPLWAPEIQYFNNTFWLTYSIPLKGNSILKSTSGKAEGPYVVALKKDAPLTTDIDGMLFKDDDGKIYSVAGSGNITLLNNDCSKAIGKTILAKPANANHVGFEGAFLFKKDKKYYLAAAEFVNGEYHCFVATADSIYGPYSNRYLAIPHAGHNSFFKDAAGNWWATFFGNDKTAPFKERPALLRIEFDDKGRIKPLYE
jgi:beta-xylosidase